MMRITMLRYYTVTKMFDSESWRQLSCRVLLEASSRFMTLIVLILGAFVPIKSGGYFTVPGGVLSLGSLSRIMIGIFFSQKLNDIPFQRLSHVSRVMNYTLPNAQTSTMIAALEVSPAYFT
ncbi:hypothetical protein BDW75DRAFT_41159 [Aspergillus navahoensis]